jgi:CRISPR-associated protein Cas5d
MSYGIKLHVWGDFALFTRPEMKVERVSYDVMTPSAARGILEAIYWKPQIRWIIHRIEVLKPIRFTNIRRNEVGKKAAAPTRAAMAGEPSLLGLLIEDERQQRASTLLRDVSYIINASFDVLDLRMERGGPEMARAAVEGKHLDIFNRKARTGQYRHHPYFGCREFPASFALLEEHSPLPVSELPEPQRNQRLGWMLHDIEYIPDTKGPIIESSRGRRLRAEPRFFNAELQNGILTIPPLAEAKA